MTSAVVLSHASVAHELGHLDPWFSDHGIEVTRVYREDRPRLPDADLLVVLGSPTSVADGYRLPAAESEIALVADWVATGRPYLGICFGAQVLACALGGRVTRLPQPFTGYVGLDAPDTPEAEGPWLVWHNDAITAPAAADVLADLHHADLAFRVGRSWGLQPHIEVTPETLARMAIALGAPPTTYDPLVAALAADATASARRARILLDLFAASALTTAA